MESYQSILAKISVLQKKASVLREAEKKHAVAEMRKLIELYDVQSAELFSDARPATGKPASPRKKVRLPMYKDPTTGKTWSGRGKRPSWLVGDKDAYLIATPTGATGNTDAQKPRTQVKEKPSAARKSSAVKATGTTKTAAKPKSTVAPKRAAKRKPARKTATAKADSAVSAALSEPAAPPSIA